MSCCGTRMLRGTELSPDDAGNTGLLPPTGDPTLADFKVGRMLRGARINVTGKLVNTDPACLIYVSDPPAGAAAVELLLDRELDGGISFGDANTISAFGFCFDSTWPGDRRLVIGICLTSSAGWDMAATAAGAHDSVFDDVVDEIETWQDRIFAVRIGWEFNSYATWAWSLGGPGSNQQPGNYIGAFRRLATKIRNRLPNVLIDWNPLRGNAIVDMWYPGDDVVDIIGLDVYLNSANYANDFSLMMDAPCGLRWQERFAAIHGKGMSFPEWATDYNDGVFITQMAAWMRRPRVAPVVYQAYWNANSGGNFALANNAVKQAAYVTAFGELPFCTSTSSGGIALP